MQFHGEATRRRLAQLRNARKALADQSAKKKDLIEEAKKDATKGNFIAINPLLFVFASHIVGSSYTQSQELLL